VKITLDLFHGAALPENIADTQMTKDIPSIFTAVLKAVSKKSNNKVNNN
jgi:hypothetical protein